MSDTPLQVKIAPRCRDGGPIEAKIMRAHLRRDTIQRFVPFEFKWGGQTFKVTSHHIEMYNYEAAEELHVHPTALSNAFVAFSRTHYGEARRWPGPVTQYYKRYIKRVPSFMNRAEMNEFIDNKNLVSEETTNEDSPINSAQPTGGL